MPDTRRGSVPVFPCILSGVALILGIYGGPIGLSLLLLSAWPVAMVLTDTSLYAFGWAYPILCAVCGIIRYPDWMMFPCILLAILAVAGVCIDKRIKMPALRAVLWGGMSLLMLSFFLASYAAYMHSSIIESISNLLCGRITSSQKADDILIRLYNSGYLGLGTLFPKDQMLADSMMTAEIRDELIRSLRSYASSLMSSCLPLLLGIWPVISAWCCLYPSSSLRRKRGTIEHVLPKAEKWFIPRDYSISLLGLWVTGMLFMNTSSTFLYAGVAIYSFILCMFAIQGSCALIFRLKRNGMNPRTRNIIVVLLLLIVPIISELYGVYDQINNTRGLRGPKESEGSK